VFRSCHSEPIRQAQGKLREESLANASLKLVQRSFVVEFIPMNIGTPQDDRKCETRNYMSQKKYLTSKKGFTLIELLIVLSIIGILAALGFSSYVNSVKAGRDARRKTDLQTIQKGLETYYQDVGSYPIGSIPNPFCHPSGCASAQYLPLLPSDPSNIPYVYDSSDGSYYKLYSCIENPNDNGPGVNQDGYGLDCSGGGGGGRCNPCRFGISSTNTTP